jgi:hypothetical protein
MWTPNSLTMGCPARTCRSTAPWIAAILSGVGWASTGQENFASRTVRRSKGRVGRGEYFELFIE